MPAEDAQRARPVHPFLEQEQAVPHAPAPDLGRPASAQQHGQPRGEIHLPGERDAPVEGGPPRAVGLEQALEILETAIDLVFDLRASLAPLGEFTRTLDHLPRAAGQAEALGDRRRLGWVSAYLTQSHYTLGEQATAIRAAERAQEAGRALRDDALQIVAAFGLGQAHHVLGDYRAAQRHLGRAVAAVDGGLSRERWGMAGLVSVASRIWLAASLADTGDFAEALAREREGVALAETPEHPWSLAGGVMTLGFVHLSQGHLGEAGPVLVEPVDLAVAATAAAR